jgi:hypothetical protein
MSKSRVSHRRQGNHCSTGKAGLHPRALDECGGQGRSHSILDTRRKQKCDIWNVVMDFLNQIRQQPCAASVTILIDVISSQ